MYKFDRKGTEIVHFWFPQIHILLWKEGLPLVTIRKIRPKRAWNYALEKGLKLCIYGSPEIHILLWNEGLPPRNHKKLYISVNLDQKGPEIMRI